MGQWLSVIKNHWAEFILLLFIAAIYIWNAGTYEISSSTFEPLYLLAAKEMAISNHFLMPTLMHTPIWEYAPGMDTFIALFFKLFDALHLLNNSKLPDFALWVGRLPSILFGLMGIYFTYRLFMQLFGNRNGAIYAALILATSWGYFQAAHIATADIAFIALFTLSAWLFQLWYELADRPKIFHVELNFYVALQVLVLALLFFIKGITGVAVPLTFYLIFLFMSDALERLSSVEWFRYLLIFFTLSAAWLTWIVLHEPQGGQIFSTLLLRPWIPFWWGQGVLQSLMNIAMHGKTLLGAFFPWILFAVGALMLLFDPRNARKLGSPKEPRVLFLLTWTALTAAYYMLWVPPGSLYLYLFLPALAILTGHFLSVILEENRPDSILRTTTEGTILMLMLVSVLLSVYIFQVLPDDYPGHLWTLSGKPILYQLHFGHKDIELAEPFPVWKLWLIPGPAILLFGGLIMYFIKMSERYNAIPETMITMFLVFLGFYSAVASPAVNRPLGQYYAKQLAAFAQTYNVTGSGKHLLPVVFYSSQEFLSPPVSETLFYWNTHNRHPIYLFQHPQDLSNYISTISSGADPLIPIAMGIMTEEDYYSLPAEEREHLRIRGQEWTWSFPVMRLFPARSHEMLLDRIFHFSSLQTSSWQKQKMLGSQQQIKEILYKRQPFREHLLLFSIIKPPEEPGAA